MVALSDTECHYLEAVAKTGKESAYRITRARVLLKADIYQPGGGWSDAQISNALDVSVTTLDRLRKRFAEECLEATLKQRQNHFP